MVINGIGVECYTTSGELVADRLRLLVEAGWLYTKRRVGLLLRMMMM